MMPTTLMTDFYPNRVGRYFLLAVEEVIGRTGVSDLLKLADLPHRLAGFPPDDLQRGYSIAELGKLQNALESLYGKSCGLGMQQRAGRVCFKYWLRNSCKILGCSQMEFKLLPQNSKIRLGLEMFSGELNRIGDLHIDVTEDPEKFIWKTHRCPVCRNRVSDSPICHLTVGILQESLNWLSGGKHFQVVETECSAMGAPACVFEIKKTPID